MVVVLTAGGVVYADRGAIPFNAQVRVFEPNQRALLAWNGEEEILILSTDLRVSQSSKVLEVMPFPAEPVVTNADVAVFGRAVGLINAKLYQAAAERLASSRSAATASAGEITFHEKIGAHDVAVAHVLDPEGFIAWVNDYLRKSQVDNPVIPGPLRATVQQYLNEGYSWFVFDVVSLETRLRSTDALQYRFKSASLYYPIRISRANQGQTSIQLLVLTPTMLRTFSGIPMARVDLRHKPVTLSAAEVRSVHSEIDDLLGHREGVKLRVWWIRGAFQELNQDLLAR